MDDREREYQAKHPWNPTMEKGSRDLWQARGLPDISVERRKNGGYYATISAGGRTFTGAGWCVPEALKDAAYWWSVWTPNP